MNPTVGQRFDRIEAAMPYKPQSRALDPREVVIAPGWNVRDMRSPAVREHIQTIKASILERVNDNPPLPALIKPIEVTYDIKTGVTTLVDGECRLTACRELWNAGHEVYVASKVVEGTDAQLFATALASNAGRAYTEVEIAEGIRRLHVGQLWSAKKVAAHICRPLRYVTDALQLAAVPDEAKQLLNQGAVTKDAVLHAAKGKDGDSLDALKTRAAARPMPTQTALPGVSSKTKPTPPVARPKKQSAKEAVAKAAPSLLELADAMYRLIMDPQIPRSELRSAAQPYGKARGL